MNTEMHSLLDTARSPAPSRETISLEQQAIRGLASRYNDILRTYISQDLLRLHPDQAALLDAQAGLVQQQQTLAASSLRTWQLYATDQEQILQDISSGDLAAAQHLIRFQAEPTNADALSALHALIQLDEGLAGSVQQQAASEEQGELIVTIIGIFCAALTITLVGWFISGTLVRRLKHLRQVTRAIEQGELDARVTVIGRDEIADVSAAFNAMLEAILKLLQETRRQRDALTNAAEHLFSDMHVISSGDLRMHTRTSTDPTSMLADALNFAAGRIRRFRLRIQGISQQFEVLARQLLEHSEALTATLNTQQDGGKEVARTGAAFATEMTKLTRQIMMLAQQLRHAVENF
jgi:methyl-accepting chemotaxis protein